MTCLEPESLLNFDLELYNPSRWFASIACYILENKQHKNLNNLMSVKVPSHKEKHRKNVLPMLWLNLVS